MLNAKINVNGIEVYLTGDKEDIVYALKNTTSNSIPTEQQIIQKISSTVSIKKENEKKPSLFSKEDTIGMYQFLASQGNFTIKQFEITRGGKTNPTQYTVCLVFDNDRQRYCYYNPKTEDRFLQSFSINDVIARINASESGFSLLHTVSNKIWEKMNVLNKLVRSSNVKTNPFPMLNSSTTTGNIVFNNYESKNETFASGVMKVMKKNEWLTSKQIWDRMSKIGFTTKGKTPSATIASIIYTDIKNHGPNSVFEKENGRQAFRIKS